MTAFLISAISGKKGSRRSFQVMAAKADMDDDNELKVQNLLNNNFLSFHSFDVYI